MLSITQSARLSKVRLLSPSCCETCLPLGSAERPAAVAAAILANDALTRFPRERQFRQFGLSRAIGKEPAAPPSSHSTEKA